MKKGISEAFFNIVDNNSQKELWSSFTLADWLTYIKLGLLHPLECRADYCVENDLVLTESDFYCPDCGTSSPLWELSKYINFSRFKAFITE